MKLLRILGLATALLLTTSHAFAASEKYTLDKEHTGIVFMIKHADFSSMIGQFREFDGYIQLDRENPEKSTLHVNIDPTSIQTSSGTLDSMLKSKQFFDTKKYSNIHFASTKIKRTGKNTADVTGDLRMHGTISPVTLHVTMNKDAEFFGTQRIGFSARGKLKRSDFTISEGIPLVSDEVELIIETEFVKEKAK